LKVKNVAEVQEYDGGGSVRVSVTMMNMKLEHKLIVVQVNGDLDFLHPCVMVKIADLLVLWRCK